MSNQFNMDRVSSDMINLAAKQMGAADVRAISAYINVYTFNVAEDFVIKYLLEIRRDSGMYLHRMMPYPMTLGKFYGEVDVTEYMKRDLAKFRHAQASSNFDRFLTLADGMSQVNRRMEQLFLNRNVPREAFDELTEEMQRIRATLEQVASETPLLYDQEYLVEVPADK